MDNNILQPVRYKAIETEMKAVEGKSRTVSFYASYFNSIDSDGEILIKGAFAKSITEHGPTSASAQKIAYLYQHQLDKPIGRITTMREDDKGLYCEAILDNIQLADEVNAQYQSGTLNQHSIGFRYILDKVEYDEKKEAVILKEVQLMEVSVVTIGANENTPFVGFKAEKIENEKKQHAKDIEDILKSLDMNLAYKLRQLISKSVALSQVEPPVSTQKQEPQIDWETVVKKLT